MRRLAFTILFSIPGFAYPQTADDVLLTVLRIKNYAAAVKASIRPGCKPDNPLSAIPQYKALCPKLDMIPGSVIETAALPYLKLHMKNDEARQAIAFWSSPQGATLGKKMLIEIESGTRDKLTDEDLVVLDRANKAAYGLALSALATDKNASMAVVGAMLDYEP